MGHTIIMSVVCEAVEATYPVANFMTLNLVGYVRQLFHSTTKKTDNCTETVLVGDGGRSPIFLLWVQDILFV